MIIMILGHVGPEGQSLAKEEVVGAHLGHTEAGVFGLIWAGIEVTGSVPIHQEVWERPWIWCLVGKPVLNWCPISAVNQADLECVVCQTLPFLSDDGKSRKTDRVRALTRCVDFLEPLQCLSEHYIIQVCSWDYMIQIFVQGFGPVISTGAASWHKYRLSRNA